MNMDKFNIEYIESARPIKILNCIFAWLIAGFGGYLTYLMFNKGLVNFIVVGAATLLLVANAIREVIPSKEYFCYGKIDQDIDWNEALKYFDIEPTEDGYYRMRVRKESGIRMNWSVVEEDITDSNNDDKKGEE